MIRIRFQFRSLICIRIQHKMKKSQKIKMRGRNKAASDIEKARFCTNFLLLENCYCLDPEPESELFQSRNRNRNKSLRFHSTSSNTVGLVTGVGELKRTAQVRIILGELWRRRGSKFSRGGSIDQCSQIAITLVGSRILVPDSNPHQKKKCVIQVSGSSQCFGSGVHFSCSISLSGMFNFLDYLQFSY